MEEQISFEKSWLQISGNFCSNPEKSNLHLFFHSIRLGCSKEQWILTRLNTVLGSVTWVTWWSSWFWVSLPSLIGLSLLFYGAQSWSMVGLKLFLLVSLFLSSMFLWVWILNTFSLYLLFYLFTFDCFKAFFLILLILLLIRVIKFSSLYISWLI